MIKNGEEDRKINSLWQQKKRERKSSTLSWLVCLFDLPPWLLLYHNCLSIITCTFSLFQFFFLSFALLVVTLLFSSLPLSLLLLPLLQLLLLVLFYLNAHMHQYNALLHYCIENSVLHIHINVFKVFVVVRRKLMHNKLV